MRLHHSSTVRRGFTLVEVLVAAGLSMLIMLVVTQAFQRGMDTLSQLKSVGEMQQRLRAFQIVMKNDLEATHFESRYGTRVSDQRLDLLSSTTLTNDSAPWRPPTKGFFRIMNGDPGTPTQYYSTSNPSLGYAVSPTENVEATDPDGNVSTRAVDHMLHMTVKRDATRGDKMFTAALPSSLTSNSTSWNLLSPMCLSQMYPSTSAFSSDWAEVVYFLDTMNPVGTTPGGTPIYGLYRRVRELASNGTPTNVSMSTGTNGILTGLSALDQSLCQAISSSPVSIGSITRPLNGPVEIRTPANRLGGITSARSGSANPWDNITCEQTAPGQTGSVPTGSDLLLNDVISFEIKADWDGGTTTPAGVNSTSFEYPFNVLPTVSASRNPLLANRRVFDTWVDTFPTMTNVDDWIKVTGNTEISSGFLVPQTIRLRAVQIKVRVWDRKNNMARQITLVESL